MDVSTGATRQMYTIRFTEKAASSPPSRCTQYPSAVAFYGGIPLGFLGEGKLTLLVLRHSPEFRGCRV